MGKTTELRLARRYRMLRTKLANAGRPTAEAVPASAITEPFPVPTRQGAWQERHPDHSVRDMMVMIESLFELSSTGLLYVDAEGRIIDLNVAARLWLGEPAASIYMKSFLDLLDPGEDRAGILAEFDGCIREGCRRLVRVRLSAGAGRASLLTFQPMRSKDGIRYVLLAGLEIPAEQEWEWGAGVVARLFRRATEAMLILEPATWRIVDANEAAGKLLGRKRNWLVSATIGEIFDSREAYASFRERQFTSSVAAWARSCRFAARRGDTSRFDAEYRLIPILNETYEKSLVAMIITDASEKVRAAEERGYLAEGMNRIANEMNTLVERLHGLNMKQRTLTDLSLSPREQEIAIRMANGKSNKEIGAALDLTESTVKAHITCIFRKVGVRNRVEFVRFLNEAHIHL